MNNYVCISTYLCTHSIMITYIQRYKAQYVIVQNVPVFTSAINILLD